MTTYDGAGRLTAISDVNAGGTAGSEYHYVYDALNRVTHWDNVGTPEAPVVSFSAQYDAAGRRTSLIASLDGTKGFKNTYSYDALGRLTRIEQTDPIYEPTTELDKRVDIAYLADGRFDAITRYEDLAGTELVATSDYAYDAAGRLVSLDHAQGGTTLASYSWTFDAAGRITSATSVDGTGDVQL